jgi:hypothetical protein
VGRQSWTVENTRTREAGPQIAFLKVEPHAARPNYPTPRGRLGNPARTDLNRQMEREGCYWLEFSKKAFFIQFRTGGPQSPPLAFGVQRNSLEHSAKPHPRAVTAANKRRVRACNLFTLPFFCPQRSLSNILRHGPGLARKQIECERPKSDIT